MVDCLQRQFLMRYRDMFNFKHLERAMKCPENTLSRFVLGKKPLPDKWYPALRDLLMPMCDVYNSLHARTYPTDRVIVVGREHLCPGYEDMPRKKIQLNFFEKKYVKGASVVYFEEKTNIGTCKYTSIHSKYYSGKN